MSAKREYACGLPSGSGSTSIFHHPLAITIRTASHACKVRLKCNAAMLSFKSSVDTCRCGPEKIGLPTEIFDFLKLVQIKSDALQNSNLSPQWIGLFDPVFCRGCILMGSSKCSPVFSRGFYGFLDTSPKTIPRVAIVQQLFSPLKITCHLKPDYFKWTTCLPNNIFRNRGILSDGLSAANYLEDHPT